MERKIYDMVCEKHTEQKQIFRIAMLLDEARIPYHFSYDDFMRPTPFDMEPKNPETAIDWNTFDFCIFIDCLPETMFTIRQDSASRLPELKIGTTQTVIATPEAIIEILQHHFPVAK